MFAMPRRRRWAVLLCSLALTLGVVAPAAAARPTIETVTFGFYSCGFVSTDAGTAVTDASAEPDGSGFVGLALWDAGTDPFESPPAAETISFEVLSLTDDALSATVDYGTFDPETSEPTVTGTATVEASIAVVATEPIDDTFKEGNIQVREVGTRELLSVDVEVVTDTHGTFTFTDCDGERYNLTVWRTSPNAFSGHFSFFSLFCELESAPDGFAFLFADESFAEVGVFTPTLQGSGTGDVGLTTGGGSGTIPLFDDEGAPVGSATIDFTLTSLGVETGIQVSSHGRTKATQELFAVTGTLAASDGTSFDMAACGAERVSFRDHFSNPSGPKPGGKAPANDLPNDAVPAAPGSRFQLQTGGAAPAPELEASCSPMAHTVWYELTGTGADVTIDTAGSNFDTMIAVYDGAGTEIACVDDVGPDLTRTMQATVTVATEAGATYLVQVGSFDYAFFGDPPEFGRLRVRFD